MFSVFIDYVFFLLVFLKLNFNSSGFVFGSFLEVNYITSVMYNTLKESYSVTYMVKLHFWYFLGIFSATVCRGKNLFIIMTMTTDTRLAGDAH